jgi:hypothetical protein
MFGAGLAGAFLRNDTRRRNAAAGVVVLVLGGAASVEFFSHGMELGELVSVFAGLACGGMLALRRLSSMNG